MEIEGQKSGSVCLSSVPDLLLKLCESIILSKEKRCKDNGFLSFLEVGVRSFHLSWVAQQALWKKMRAACLDVMLLRQWEWLPQDQEAMGSPYCRCLGHVMSLQQQGQTDRATQLMTSLDWLLGPLAALSRPHSVLQFLHLLSHLDQDSSKEVHKPKDWIYDVYPSEVFEKLPMEICDSSLLHAATKIFEHRPGSGFKGILSDNPPYQSGCGKGVASDGVASDSGFSESSLFGALVRCSSVDLHATLDLPALPSDHTRISFIPHKMPSSSRIQYPAPPPETLPIDSALDERMMILRAAAEPCDRDWHMQQGWEGWLTDHAFACDATPPAPHHLVGYLNSRYAEFVGVSSEEAGLAQLQCPYSEQLLQLMDEVPHPPIPPVLEADHVVFSVNRCLHRLMVTCRSKLLVLADPGLSRLEKELASTFVVPVARWVVDITQQTAYKQRYELLDYFYTQASRLQGSAHYLLFLALLAQGLRTHFLTVEHWVFQGVLDCVQFIGINDDPAALDRRDELYWTNGYVASAMVLPPFLTHLSASILSCGKALNLLRLCQPQHHLCTGVCTGPSLRLCFSSEQLLDVGRKCTLYQDQIVTLSHTLHDQLEHKRLAEEEAEMAELVRARQEARKKQTQIKQWEAEQLQIEATRKRALAIELKKEIESVRALRAQRLEEESHADQDRIAAADRVAGLVHEEEALLESEARQEVEAYYKNLYREAENRRARAQWKLARLRLASPRQALWRTERLAWQQAMATETEQTMVENSPRQQVPLVGKAGEEELVLHQGPLEGGEVNVATMETELSPVELAGDSDMQQEGRPCVLPPHEETHEEIQTSTLGSHVYQIQSSLSPSGNTPPPSSRGTPPPSTIQHLLYGSTKDGTGSTISPPLESSLSPSGNTPPPSSRGTPPPSTIQHLLYGSTKDGTGSTISPPEPSLSSSGTPPPSSRGTPPPSTIQHLLYGSTKDGTGSTISPPLEPSLSSSGTPPPSSRGTPPPSTIQHLLYGSTRDGTGSTISPPLEPTLSSRGTPPPSSRGTPPPSSRGTPPSSSRGTPPPSSRGTPPPSSRGTPPPSSRGTSPPPGLHSVLEATAQVSSHTGSRAKEPPSSRGAPPPSTVKHLNPTPHDSSSAHTGNEAMPSSRGMPPHSTVQNLLYPTPQGASNTHTGNRTEGMPSSRGMPPPSTVQDLLYPTPQDSSSAHTGNKAMPSSRGMPPPSTVQNLLYPTPQGASNTHTGNRTEGMPSSRGMPPPSTVQDLLYPTPQDASITKTRATVPPTSTNISNTKHLQSSITTRSPSLVPPFKYSNNITSFDGVLLEMCSDICGHSTISEEEKDIDTAFLTIYPLSSLLADSIAHPLLTQCSLVHQALLDYIVIHCQLHRHFLALKRFLLLEDGEFGHALTTKLCEELSGGHDWKTLYSPSFLRSLLSSSLDASINRHTLDAGCLHFAIRYQPRPIHPNAVRALNYLELRYEVEWPCNIVIPAAIVHNYNKVLHFLLEMKRSVWVLKSAFHHLKDCSGLNCHQVRQLQILRHELQHFINTMHGYIASQLFGFTWTEFQTEITEHVHSLDEMIQAHRKFVERAIFRCLLSKKAKPVMNLIYELLAYILEFSSHASSISCSSYPSHVFQAMLEVHVKFRNTVKLLIEVLGKLIVRGYQPHLEELLLRVNFNHFY